VHGPELWKSDGSEVGTVLVKDISPEVGYGYPMGLAGADGTVYFAADDGVHGTEVWKSDGTEGGTVLVRDVNAGGEFSVARRGTPNLATGALRVKVKVAAPGRIVVRPVGGSLLKKTVKDVTRAGGTKVTLKPTAAGVRQLQRTGTLKVRAKVSFTPCGGTASSITRTYTLSMR
jgi:ELWxxDGT repeat protein